ncbi:MAG TPA: glycosyltransferase family 4 protein [Drouetiella sp.]
MKAVVISAAFPPLKTGGADFVHRMCSELIKHNVDIEVIGPDTGRSFDPALKLHAIEGKWNWRAAQRCITLCRQLSPDVVDIVFTGWMYHDHPMITFLPTMIKKTCEGVRVVTHIESLGGIHREKSNVVRASGRYIASWIVGRQHLNYEYGTLLRDSDAVVTLSDRDRLELIRRDNDLEAKCVTIPPPPIMPVLPTLPATERIRGRAQLGVTDEDALLSFYGYIYPGKGIEILFEALQSAINRGRKLKLLMVGDEPDAYVLERERVPNYMVDLKKMTRRLGIENHVMWSNYEPYGSTEPSRKLHLSDICVFPFTSGLNLHNSSFWFAAAHGLPIIATRSATTESDFVNRENVLFAQAQSSEDLAQKINDLCVDAALRKTLGANVLELCVRKASWDTFSNQLLNVFNNVCER